MSTCRPTGSTRSDSARQVTTNTTTNVTTEVWRGLDRHVVIETITNGVSSLWGVTDIIVRECFADEAYEPRLYFDTPEMTWFVAIAHGTALRLLEVMKRGRSGWRSRHAIVTGGRGRG